MLEPGPLSAAGRAELIRRRAPGADAELCDRCHAAAAGDLWLLGELAARRRAAVREGASSCAAGSVSSAPPSGASPTRWRSSATAPSRIASPRSPRSPSRTSAASASGSPPGLCTPRGRRFVHGLVARGVRDEMPAAERERLHRAAAAALRRDGEPAASSPITSCAAVPPPIPTATAALREAAAGAAPPRGRGVPGAGAARARAATTGRRCSCELARRRVPRRPAGSAPAAAQALAERPGPHAGEILARLAALEVVDPHDATLLDGVDDPHELAGSTRC